MSRAAIAENERASSLARAWIFAITSGSSITDRVSFNMT